MAKNRTFSTPDSEDPKFVKAFDNIKNHWDLKDSPTIRECVYLVNAWIEGSDPLNKCENLAYLKKVWIDLLKDIKKSSWKQKEREYRGFVIELLSVIEKQEIDNERLTRKYEH